MPPKRKRANTAASTRSARSIRDAVLDVAQPSSRDASEEDAQDLVLQDVSQRKSDQVNPSKRSRSANVDAPSEDAEDADADDDDTAPKRQRKNTGPSLRDMEEILEHGENGERGTMGMTPPPKAGTVDPVGYKTNPPPKGRPVRIYADGVFDLFHLGHMRVLQQAKTAFPEVHLIVGVTGDKETHRRKGLTVLSAKERAESVRHCKWVDEVVEDCPWVITDAPGFLEKHKIDYVAHDDLPYGADEGDDIYAPIKQKGMFLVTARTEGVSTTGIITKIVKDYDKYISRQLKRGTPRQELNVSWLKMNELEIKRTMSDLRNNIKSNWTNTGSEVGRELRQFWSSQISRPASPARPSAELGNGDLMPSPRNAALANISRLDIPRNPGGAQSSDFVAGYSLGLIGGVRSWMSRNRRTLNESRPESPTSDDSSGDRSPHAEPSRGRPGKRVQDQVHA
ncbi:hypothetical protein EJ05DRAFT_484411 [Pseudovirgaria hyperparasitica]|uniref:choline-phosphate cytidylyltransferase n=1 Tax=Pseudovirgaria hyperparasitica TaxID=470096 RepID=A0A6A6W9A6_9PEZI|nr:uncharacterized protein EJ05DRAFT_484411 [Pseudovirgaria hyperparasitica]KAF2759458.1 hypothetical protein EJ05DRAFT_484411 [Pseudovirgaria hyperparasitica]